MNPIPFAVTVPVDAKYLKVIRGFLQPIIEDLFEAEQADMLVLALHEACSNVVKHQGQALMGGLIHVGAELAPDSIRLRIGNFCATEDVPNIKPRDLKDFRPGGLGTHFIGQIMDRVAYEPDPGSPGRMALVMEKKLPVEEKSHGT